ncbi:MAG: glycosyltransferase, partial [Turicibacter sp.]|nr:glycosyltransferase [Turicibacter sp.]
MKKFIFSVKNSVLFSAIKAYFSRKAYSNPTFTTDKVKILFFAGNMEVNGITEVFISFVESLDFGRFDVSLLCMPEVNQENLGRLPAEIRLFTHSGVCFATFAEQLKVYAALKNGFDQAAYRIFAREHKQCFGEIQFDYVVNFSGYSPFFAALLAQADGVKYIWQHNDLAQDLNNTAKILANNRRFEFATLVGIYERYDKIVSAGEWLMKVNSRSMTNDKIADRYTYVNNPINTERIMQYVSDEQLAAAIQNRNVPKESNKFNFVTVGRLSPEKNHANLIKAFGRFCQKYAESKLYIVGDGVLKSELADLVRSLGLAENVVLTGKLANPFEIMASCDCFVFPSIYEGQGIVVLEARMLKLAIVLANYSTVESVSLPNGQLVVGFTEDEIYRGLVAFA